MSDAQRTDDPGVPGPGIDSPLFMSHLDAGLEEALRAFAARRSILVALDFDGVLAPLVDDPAASRMTEGSVLAIDRLSRAPGVQVAIVSGRDAGTLASLADLPDGTLVVASHGAERGRIAVDEDGSARLAAEPVDLDEDLTALHEAVRSGTEQVLAVHPGTRMEVKPASVTLHTRGLPEDQARRATTALLTGPAGLPGVRVISGHDVVEMAVLTVTKGDGVLDLRAETGADAVLYAGDDRTDEDAFAVLGEDDVAVKVGDGETSARFRVGDPDEAAVVLQRLAELRDGD